MQAAIQAGYSVRFIFHSEVGVRAGVNKTGVEIIARHRHWRVYYSDDSHAATPKLRIKTDVNQRIYEGTAGCLTVPTNEQVIYVRRIHFLLQTAYPVATHEPQEVAVRKNRGGWTSPTSGVLPSLLYYHQQLNCTSLQLLRSYIEFIQHLYSQ
ncbi:hypothetical protein DFS34DRAFT_300267 [Phlyctochytrium arcticum]|nr:hypothetical protein DFS34DRAFT_300267 [Phlyctochytrium arcticum]